MNSLSRTLLICTIIIIHLTACDNKKPPSFRISKTASVGDLQLMPCTVELDSKEYSADCGNLIVPEKRADPASRLIALPIIRIRTTNNNYAEPIFYLNGGPGQSNLLASPLSTQHDFVLVGYRGVDGSVKLNCPEVQQAIKGDGINVLNKTSRAKLSASMRQCGTRLQTQGIDLDGYTIREVIADMEAARVSLGYKRINLFSISYGTRVAQLYAAQYPEQVHRSIMVSVNPPGRFVWEPQMVDRQIKHYSQLYAQTTGTQNRNLTETMKKISRNMPEQWLLLNIDPGKVKIVTFLLLFHRNTAALVFDAWLAAENGDPSGLALMTQAYDLMMPDSCVWGDFLAKGISADYDSKRNYSGEMNPADSVMGSPLSQLIWGSATDENGVTWATTLLPSEYRQLQHSEVETLLVSGNIDFSTPAEYATHDLLPTLPKGKQLILSEMGHVNDVISLQEEAFERLLNHFYATGEVDDSQFSYEAMDFEVGLGLQGWAKIALGCIVLLFAILMLIPWFIVRRLRNT